MVENDTSHCSNLAFSRSAVSIYALKYMAKFTKMPNQLSFSSPTFHICEYLVDLVADTYDSLFRATKEPKLEAEIKIKPRVCQSVGLTSSLQGSSADGKEQSALVRHRR